MICSEGYLDDRQSPVKMVDCPSCRVRKTTGGNCHHCEPRKAKMLPMVLSKGTTRYRVVMYAASAKGIVRVCKMAKDMKLPDKLVSEHMISTARASAVELEDGRVVNINRMSPGRYMVELSDD